MLPYSQGTLAVGVADDDRSSVYGPHRGQEE